MFDGVARSLPALAYAQHLQRKAAKVGFDWPDVDGPLAKVDEELAELREAIAGGDEARIADELGDLVVAVVNVARHVHVDAELALRGAAAKFRRRFEGVEALAAARGIDLRAADLATLDAPLGRGQGHRALRRPETWSDRGRCGCSSPIRRTTRTSGCCRSPTDLDDWDLPHMHGVLGLHRHVVRLVELGPEGQPDVLRRQGAARPPRPARVPLAARAGRRPPADGRRRRPSSPGAPATATAC